MDNVVFILPPKATLPRQRSCYFYIAFSYLNRNPGFTKEDLPRLEHERQRLYHVNDTAESLKWAAVLGKCVIPVGGLVWAILSALESPYFGRSDATSADEWVDSWAHKTQKEKLQDHIDLLKV